MKNEATVIVVGAGLTGIAVSYYLGRNNIDHLVLEKSGGPGGIWSSHNWPGIRCDTDIIKYSYSFRPLLSDRCLVSGECIAKYLAETSDALGIGERTIYDTRVERAEFSGDDNRWRIYTSRGVFSARFVINANGYFHDRPHKPGFEGSDDFQGRLLHLFELDARAGLEKRNIVLVGSGASAISAAPILCERAASVTLLQRTPSYIYEESNHPGIFVRLAQALYRKGIRYPVRIVTWLMQFKDDLVFVLFRGFPGLAKLVFRQHWKDTVDRKTYSSCFSPPYNPWEQRIPLAIGLKRQIKSGKLRILSGEIDRFTRNGIRLKDSRTLPADLCILATGFDLAFFKFDVLIDGRQVDTAGINFYKGMMMGGIPNYFQPFVAPHSSFTRRVEDVSRLIVKVIRYMHRRSLTRVWIERKRIEQKPRITPGYVVRNLGKLPAIYGTLELPSIDRLLFFHFRKSNFNFQTNEICPENQK